MTRTSTIAVGTCIAHVEVDMARMATLPNHLSKAVFKLVAVWLDAAFNISFLVDGVDKGIAFKTVAQDHSIPLYLVF